MIEKPFREGAHLSCGAHSAWLTIDLAAIGRNYDFLQKRVESKGAECAVVLKADAYGLGMEPVMRALTGRARSFFVAHFQEGIKLRRIFEKSGDNVSRIFVLHGFFPKDAPFLVQHGLIPVLNTIEQFEEWQNLARTMHPARLQAALQFDTGMSRFGLSEADLQIIKAQTPLAFDLALLVSHLACADDLSSPANHLQRECFVHMTGYFPGVPRSLAASSGIFLGNDYHFEMVRPGAALYGIAPNNSGNPLEQILEVKARIQQMLNVPKGVQAGYGLAWQAQRDSILATVGLGYADGLFRALAGKGAVFWYKGQPVPVVGRVSMDSVSVDMTDIAGSCPKVGDEVVIIGGQTSLDRFAAWAGTISYEVLTSLGHRFARFYRYRK